MRSTVDYAEDIRSEIDYLLGARYFDIPYDDDKFEFWYHTDRQKNHASFTVVISGVVYNVNIWSTEADLLYVRKNIDKITYVREDRIGVLEDTIVGNVPEFLDSIDCDSALDIHYSDRVDFLCGAATESDLREYFKTVRK